MTLPGITPQIYPNTSTSAYSTAMNLIKEEREYNSAEAQKNRDWQEEMSNTAYQRQVEDMKKAGLNPYLALGGSGASVGSGASASSNGFASSVFNSLMNNVNTILKNQTARDTAFMNNFTKIITSLSYKGNSQSRKK